MILLNNGHILVMAFPHSFIFPPYLDLAGSKSSVNTYIMSQRSLEKDDGLRGGADTVEEEEDGQFKGGAGAVGEDDH